MLRQLCTDLLIALDERAARRPLPYAFLLACIPIVLFSIVGVGKPAAPTPIPVRAVAIEGIRQARIDDTTFRRRWEPLNDARPAIEVRYVERSHGETRGVTDGAASVQPLQSPPAREVVRRRHRITLTTRPARLDVCARHKMRKQFYTRGRWQYWRCRR